MNLRRGLAVPAIALAASASMIGMAGIAAADGGDFSLDFVAAEPTSYDHQTGVGGEFGDRTIGEDVVESLEGGDFSCGDLVVYFVEITVAPDATETQDIELDFSFLAEPTGQPGVGQVELVSATGNPGDSGNVGNTADTTVQIVGQAIDTTEPQDTLEATVAINNLDPGETFILRLTTRLECIAGSHPTGNISGAIDAGRVVSPTADVINVGQQTVPFKVAGLIVPPVDQPATYTVDVGACPAAGSPTVPVTITIDPPGSVVVTITGPGGPYVVDGDGAVLDLPPGDYTAVGDPADGFSLEVPTITFTVQDCPENLEPSEVTVDVGACPAPGSLTVPVTITIDPADSAVVTITGPGGPYVVDGAGAVLDLPPGDFIAVAEPADGFFIEVDTIPFTVPDCPAVAVPATVDVSVGACPGLSSATRPVTVTIDPANAADVEVSGPNGFNEVVTGSGSTGNLAPGTYTYTATANPGFELTGQTEGTFTVGRCELPMTGTNVAGLVGVGLAFLSVGFGITRLSRRPTLIG